MNWLVFSIMASVILTVLLNLGLRMFPNASDRAARSVAQRTAPSGGDRWTGDRRVKVYFPWRAMLIGSLVLTILLNLVLLIV